ncbi:MAG: S8/S53 family peptidase [Verrucomicrobiota bacterium]|nr:S8/S53 family peptidase [Limisphaera sp.]MDW8382768.1 S8/S53 family peptidase [Verrucomicrobiota bacterium]
MAQQLLDRTQRRYKGILLILVCACSLGWTASERQNGPLAWNVGRHRVDADIEGWPLEKVLHEIARQTGWRVWMEPGVSTRVTTRFRDLPSGEALRRLLDRMNFALLPQTNGPAHLYVFRTSLQDATQPILSERLPSRDPQSTARLAREWIIIVKPGVDPDVLARLVGAEIVGRLDALRAYRFRFASPEAAERARQALTTSTDVEAIEDNYQIARPSELHPVLSTSLGPPQIRPRPVDANEKVVVALIDTAVQVLPRPLEDFLLPTLTVAGTPELPADQPTHGTAMAQTALRALEMLAGSGSGVRLLPVDVYGNQSVTTTFELAAGIYRAVQEGGARILNLSLGSEADSPLLRNLLQQISRSGVVVLAAAGNQPTTEPVYPAAYPDVIAVTAGDRTGRIAPYANRGNFVDVVAPGASVIYHHDRPYIVMGTSAATAFASGLAAGLMEVRGLPPSKLPVALQTILGGPSR